MTDAQLAARVNHSIQPTSNAAKPAERRARVEVGSAGALEAAADFGERQRDQHRRHADRRDHPRAPGAGRRGQRRGQREYRAADDLVDADRGEIPAPSSRAERGARAAAAA